MRLSRVRPANVSLAVTQRKGKAISHRGVNTRRVMDVEAHEHRVDGVRREPTTAPSAVAPVIAAAVALVIAAAGGIVVVLAGLTAAPDRSRLPVGYLPEAVSLRIAEEVTGAFCVQYVQGQECRLPPAESRVDNDVTVSGLGYDGSEVPELPVDHSRAPVLRFP